jgi:hypothetical protein
MLHRARSVWLLSACTIALSASLPAQQASPLFHRWEAPATGTPSDTLSPPQGDYRYEGLAFGGLVFGALGAWLGSRNYATCPTVPGAQCSGNSDKLLGGVALGLAGAAVGGGLGYLVGRFSPKKARPDTLWSTRPELMASPDSIRIQVGYQHWRGAGIGLAIGTGVGVVLGALASTISSCDDCGESASLGEAAVMTGLLGAGAGSVVGFVAGLSSPKYATIPKTAPAE